PAGRIAGALHGDAPIVASLLEDEALAEGRRDGDELGMDSRTVEALVVVLDEDLPVGVQLGHGLARGLQLAHLPGLVLQGQVTLVLERLANTLAGLAEVDEGESLPDVDLDGPQRERRAVELVLVDERRPDQVAVVRVRPGVVRALDRPLRVPVRLGIADARAAVTAHVVEAAQLAVLAADEEDALPHDVDGEEIPRLRRLVGATGVEPLAEEDLLPLELEHVRSVVIPSVESRAPRARHGHHVTTVTLSSASEA